MSKKICKTNKKGKKGKYICEKCCRKSDKKEKLCRPKIKL